MDSRETRGRALAQDPRIKHIDGPLWFCPSESAGGWIVDADAGRCQCPDAARGVKCKHLIAIELVRGGQVKPDATQAALALPPPPSRAPTKADLTGDEMAHVRAALKFMRLRCGGWAALTKTLRLNSKSLQKMRPGARMAVRLARAAGVPVDAVLTGHFPPPGACPHCGRGPEPTPPSLPSP